MKKFYYSRNVDFGYVIGLLLLFVLIIAFFGKIFITLFEKYFLFSFIFWFLYFGIIVFLFYKEKKPEKFSKLNPNFDIIFGKKYFLDFINNSGKEEKIFYENIILIKIIAYKDDYKNKILIKTQNKKYIFYKNNFYTSRFGNFYDFCIFLDKNCLKAEKINFENIK